MSKRAWFSWMAIAGLVLTAAPGNAREFDGTRDVVRDEAVPLGDAACGKPGLPDCPLQAWMKANIVGPKSAGNAQLLAKNLTRIAALAPAASGWSADWKTISDAGATAAAKSDKDGVNASCTSCHNKYRKEYREKYRANPVPN
jgi:hypothetical protein